MVIGHTHLATEPITATLCFPIWFSAGVPAQPTSTRLSRSTAVVADGYKENIKTPLTQAVSLRPTPQAGEETLSHCRSRQNIAKVTAENGRCTEGCLGPNSLPIRWSRYIPTGNDCKKMNRRVRGGWRWRRHRMKDLGTRRVSESESLTR